MKIYDKFSIWCEVNKLTSNFWSLSLKIHGIFFTFPHLTSSYTEQA